MKTDERATKQPGEWELVHIVRRTWWHIDEGWSAIDARHRRRWILTLLLGLAALLALTALLVVIARGLDARGALAGERAFIARFANANLVPFGWAIWLESPGNAIVMWPLVLAAAGIAAWNRRPLLALSFAGGFALLDAAVLLGWTIWKRARPDVVAGGIASSSESFSAFPSGHVSQTIFAYGLLIALWSARTNVRGERVLAWSLLVLLAAVVAAGRLRLGAHWPSDIVAGALIGGAWLGIVLFALRRAETRA